MSVRRDKKTNLWLVDISTKNPINGKRRRIVRKNFLTKSRAFQEEQKLKIIFLNEKIAKEICRIQLLFDLMLLDDRKDKRVSYLTTQKYVYYAHIEPYFRYSIIYELDYSSLITFREHLIEKDLSNNTINKIMILLKKILDIAVRQQVLSDNPCSLIKKLPIIKRDMSFWTIQQFLIFDKCFHPDETIFKLFFRIAFFTGMRKGEILALRWQHIDLDIGMITVARTVTKIGGREYFNDTKTKAGMRRISINQQLINFFNQWKMQQKEILKDYLIDRENEEMRIFEMTPFRVLDAGNIRKKFEQLLKRVPDLPIIRIHDFRHSHAAMLINLETEPYLIKERLGHASIRTTYDVYGHLYPSKQKSIADKLDLIID